MGGRLRISSGMPRCSGELIDLGLVEMRDGLEVGRAVALLHEEALVVLEAVGRARNRVVEAIRVVVLGHLADALLVVGGRHELQISRAP